MIDISAPTWKPGDRVWYAPVAGAGPVFRAIVDGVPWDPHMCGSGVWLVRLRDLPPEYAQSTGRAPGTTTVAAAEAHQHVFPRDEGDDRPVLQWVERTPKQHAYVLNGLLGPDCSSLHMAHHIREIVKHHGGLTILWQEHKENGVSVQEFISAFPSPLTWDSGGVEACVREDSLFLVLVFSKDDSDETETNWFASFDLESALRLAVGCDPNANKMPLGRSK